MESEQNLEKKRFAIDFGANELVNGNDYQHFTVPLAMVWVQVILNADFWAEEKYIHCLNTVEALENDSLPYLKHDKLGSK